MDRIASDVDALDTDRAVFVDVRDSPLIVECDAIGGDLGLHHCPNVEADRDDRGAAWRHGQTGVVVLARH